MSLTSAIIVAGILVALGLAVGIAVAAYYAYRLMVTITIFKATDNARDAAMLHRSMNGKPPKPPEESPEKKVAQMPDIGIHEMGENPVARKNLRKKLNATPEVAY